ncbi:Pr6Pr family membrane protein [Candidatus Saccharibacteria bacterium]|nr:Pr6Pr family membrane protein [Candidatus Saccharibacteria bacterium]
MKQNKKFLIGYKLFFSLLGFGAIITEIATTVERGNFSPTNFFSYFTIETNILVTLTLLLSAIAIAAGKNSKLDTLRSAVTVYILIVGIGFSVLLAGIEGIVLTAVPWDNTVLHYILPIAVLVDFLIDRPKRKLSFKKSLVWLLFPVTYLIYSLLRGGLIGWYPYPFLNPDIEGYGAVAITVAGLLALSLVLIWIVTRLTVSGGKKS